MKGLSEHHITDVSISCSVDSEGRTEWRAKWARPSVDPFAESTYGISRGSLNDLLAALQKSVPESLGKG